MPPTIASACSTETAIGFFHEDVFACQQEILRESHLVVRSQQIPRRLQYRRFVRVQRGLGKVGESRNGFGLVSQSSVRTSASPMSSQSGNARKIRDMDFLCHEPTADITQSNSFHSFNFPCGSVFLIYTLQFGQEGRIKTFHPVYPTRPLVGFTALAKNQ